MLSNEEKGVLAQAKELLEKKELCKGSNALDANGKRVPTGAGDPVSYCTYGAIEQVAWSKYGRHGRFGELIMMKTRVIEALEQEAGLVAEENADHYLQPIVKWNDEPERTKEDVLSLMQRLLEKA